MTPSPNHSSSSPPRRMRCADRPEARPTEHSSKPLRSSAAAKLRKPSHPHSRHAPMRRPDKLATNLSITMDNSRGGFGQPERKAQAAATADRTTSATSGQTAGASRGLTFSFVERTCKYVAR